MHRIILFSAPWLTKILEIVTNAWVYSSSFFQMQFFDSLNLPNTIHTVPRWTDYLAYELYCIVSLFMWEFPIRHFELYLFLCKSWMLFVWLQKISNQKIQTPNISVFLVENLVAQTITWFKIDFLRWFKKQSQINLFTVSSTKFTWKLPNNIFNCV